MCAAIGHEKAQFELNCWAIHESYNERTFEVQIVLVTSTISQISLHKSTFEQIWEMYKAYKMLSDGCWILNVCSS